jgi:hypothetical protein
MSCSSYVSLVYVLRCFNYNRWAGTFQILVTLCGGHNFHRIFAADKFNACDDTINIHPDWGPITATVHEARCNPEIESQSDVCLLRL